MGVYVVRQNVRSEDYLGTHDCRGVVPHFVCLRGVTNDEDPVLGACTAL